MFKLLVKNKNVTVFVLEDQYSCSSLVNDYIKGSNEFTLNDLLKEKK